MRSGTSGKKEANLAIVLCCIVIIFVICHIPRVILSIHELFLMEDIIRLKRFCHEITEISTLKRCDNFLVRPVWNICLTSANHLLLALSSSVNLLIYCSIGTWFKKSVSKLFCRTRNSLRGERQVITKTAQSQNCLFHSHIVFDFQLPHAFMVVEGTSWG